MRVSPNTMKLFGINAKSNPNPAEIGMCRVKPPFALADRLAAMSALPHAHVDELMPTQGPKRDRQTRKIRWDQLDENLEYEGRDPDREVVAGNKTQTRV